MSRVESNFDAAAGNMSDHDIRPVPDSSPQALLARARTRAAALELPFAGAVTPPEAWALFQSGAALLVDVRTIEEFALVGHVPQSLHVAWPFGTRKASPSGFLDELEQIIPKQAVLLLLCRSGKRSADAAEFLTDAGYANAFNVLEGFEGRLDAEQHRGRLDGWRHWGLPWIQE